MTYDSSGCDIAHSLATIPGNSIPEPYLDTDLIVSSAAKNLSDRQIEHLISRLEAIVALRNIDKATELFQVKKPDVNGHSGSWIESQMKGRNGPYYYERAYREGRKVYIRYIGNRAKLSAMLKEEQGASA